MTTRKQRDAEKRLANPRKRGGRAQPNARAIERANANASFKRTVKPGSQPQGYRFGPNPLDTTEQGGLLGPPTNAKRTIDTGGRTTGVRDNTIRSTNPFGGPQSTGGTTKSGIGGTQFDGGVRKRK